MKTQAILQYNAFVDKYPGAVILMQMGDFFEGFNESAKTLNKVLGLTITQRSETPMAGLPYHSIEPYIGKLVLAGYKVVIIENTDKKPDGTIIRDVVRIESACQ